MRILTKIKLMNNTVFLFIIFFLVNYFNSLSIIYLGLCLVSLYILPTYSPIKPTDTNWTPPMNQIDSIIKNLLFKQISFPCRTWNGYSPLDSQLFSIPAGLPYYSIKMRSGISFFHKLFT